MTRTPSDNSEQRARLGKTFAYFAVFVALGLGGVVLGPTLQGLADHTLSTLSQISIVFSARAFGYMVGAFVSGRLYDRMPGHPVIAAMIVGMAVTLFLTPLVPYLWLLVVVLLVLGVAEGGVDVGGNAMLVWVHGSRLGPFMNGLHFFWGVGAFLSPIIIARTVLLSGDITLAYWLIAVLVLPPAFVLLRLPSPLAHTHAAGRPSGPLNMKLLLLILAFFAVYVGAEGTFGGWIFTYAVSLGMGDRVTAAYLTSVFWGSLTLGRLLSIPLATRFRPSTILLGDLLGCLFSVALILLFQRSATIVWVGTFGAGLFMASMFPTLIAFAERRMAISGQITGFFLLASAAGGMTIPWLVGQLFERIGPRVTIVMAFASIVIALLAFSAALRIGGEAAPDAAVHREATL